MDGNQAQKGKRIQKPLLFGYAVSRQKKTYENTETRVSSLESMA
jgi:hypothetical protein